MFGAALFYGDSVITPAISVLGAAEGLEVAAPALKTWVVPISVGILIGLFVVQRHGTRRVGSAFGPIILLWFAVLAATGVWQIVQEPTIVQALDPRRAFEFLRERGWHVFAAVGAIVLALTGAEALYADMGHFGRRPIQIAWTGIVLPALALNYMGQGALLMRDPGALDNPFFRLFSSAWLMPGAGAGDLRGGDRIAGGDLRRLLDDAPGDPARRPAAHARRLHVGEPDRPDLHAGRQPACCSSPSSARRSPSAARRRSPARTASPSP